MTTIDLPSRLRRLPVPARARSTEAPSRRKADRVALSPGVQVTRWVLIVLSGLSLWLVAYALVFSGIQEHRSQRTLYDTFRRQLAKATAPTGGPIAPGKPVAILNAPAGGLHDVVVVEGTASEEMRAGPGHRRDSVLPGQAGVSLIYGRSVTFGGPFRSVTHLGVGDVISTVTGQGLSLYRVEGIRHAGDPLPKPLASGAGQLTLATAQSGGWRGGWAPSDTVYVDALLIKPKVGISSPGVVPVVPKSETAMHGDTSALVALVFWLQGLLLAGLAVVWAWRRWGHRQTWLVGSAVIVALLWGASSAAALLLPNLV